MNQRFTPYGQLLARDSAVVAMPKGLHVGWTGRETDPETGLTFHRARYCSPELRRWTQEDPIGYGGGGNLYAYVGGAVLTGRDPSGLIEDLRGGGGLGAAQAVRPWNGSDPFTSGLDNVPLPDGGGRSRAMVGDVMFERLHSEPSTMPGREAWIAGCGNKGNCTQSDVGPDNLRFDGRALWMRDGSGTLIGAWNAVSGMPGGADPIPEGLYLARQADLQRIGLAQAILGFVSKGLLEPLTGGPWFTWPGSVRSWGDLRIPLIPLQEQRRGGMFLHGGWIPGSGGCIDLTGQMGSFVGAFVRQERDMILRVKY